MTKDVFPGAVFLCLSGRGYLPYAAEKLEALSPCQRKDVPCDYSPASRRQGVLEGLSTGGQSGKLNELTKEVKVKHLRRCSYSELKQTWVAVVRGLATVT